MMRLVVEESAGSTISLVLTTENVNATICLCIFTLLTLLSILAYCLLFLNREETKLFSVHCIIH